MSSDQGASFDQVLAHELDAIAARREANNQNKTPPPPMDNAPKDLPPDGVQRWRASQMNLVGLAFSGGGIRSATLNLGILQGLARHRILPIVDYLSTVSGGGYIGGWLAAWIKREGDLDNVQNQLAPQRATQADARRHAAAPGDLHQRIIDDEPEPIHHLRSYSRYLAPRKGLLSADSWTLLAIYLRNLFINFLLLIPAALAVVLLGRLFVWLFSLNVDRNAPFYFSRALLMYGVFVGSAAWGYVNLVRERGRLASIQARGEDQELRPGEVGCRIILPLMIAAISAAWCYSRPVGEPRLFPDLRLPTSQLNLSFTATTSIAQAADGDDVATVDKFDLDSDPAADEYRFSHSFLLPLYTAGIFAMIVLLSTLSLGNAIRSAITGAIFAICMGALASYVATGNILRPEVFNATVRPPIFIILLLIAGYSEVALSGRNATEYEREWRSRIGAYLLMTAAGWLLFFGASLYLTDFTLSIIESLTTKYQKQLTAGTITSWIITTAGSVLAGRKAADSGRKSASWRVGLIIAVGPWIFLAGLVALLSETASCLLHWSPIGDLQEFVARWPISQWIVRGDWYFFEGISELAWGPWLLVCIGVLLLVAWQSRHYVDVNLFSLHMTYANRLTRCYLGASRRKRAWKDRLHDGVWLSGPGGAPTNVAGPERIENPLTDMDLADDMPLTALRIVPVIPEAPADYQGPYHLFNATLNLVGDGDLGRQDRLADSFILSPDWCGSTLTGYSRLRVAGNDADNLTLGRAVTISGAAADPNMSVNHSTAQTALMTVLNARLGWWMQNPKRAGDAWNAAGPSAGFLLLDELRGHTGADHDYVHLSDGGHFENLGVYELIRRRVRYIIAIDAAEDPNDASENLANLIRRVRTDFGIQIEIDTSRLRKDEKGLSKTHVAIGRIGYDEVDDHSVAGTLIFIRSSLTGDEPADLRNYAIDNPVFPHHPTSDQFFDEDQFESYRALGYHMADQVFGEAAKELARPDRANDPSSRNRRFFAQLRHEWSPRPPDLNVRYASAVADCQKVLRDLASHQDLVPLNHNLYPELEKMGLARSANRADIMEFRTIDQMIQVMELAWMGLDLDRYHGLGENRGWMNTFRRWAASDTFRKYWPVLSTTYGRDFALFCQRELNLDPIRIGFTQIPKDHDKAKWQRETLDRQFALDWKKAAQQWVAQMVIHQSDVRERIQNHYLDWLIDSASLFSPEKPPVWFLTLIPTASAPEVGLDEDRYPCGIVLLRPVTPLDQAAGFFDCTKQRYELELFLWLVGAYRSIGIGKQIMPKILQKFRDDGIRNKDGRLPILLVRYPDDSVGPGERMQRTRWSDFFQDHGFRRRRRVTGASRDLILELDLHSGG
jgi:GNAT superfamily N-acetyltransferase